MAKKQSSNILKYSSKRGRPSLEPGKPSVSMTVMVGESVNDALFEEATRCSCNKSDVVREILSVWLEGLE